MKTDQPQKHLLLAIARLLLALQQQNKPAKELLRPWLHDYRIDVPPPKAQ